MATQTSTLRIGGFAGAAGLMLCLAASACIPRPPPLADAPLQGLQPTSLDEGIPPTFVMTPTEPPAAAAVVVHGLKGSAGVFAQPARRWIGQGIETYAVSLTYPEADPAQLDLLIRKVASRRPDIPLFVIAESLGACLTLATLGRTDAPVVDGVVLSGPAIWPDAMSASATRNGLQWLNWLVGGDAGFWAKVVGMMDEARDLAKAVSIRPILILSGGRDEVVPRKGIEELVKGLGAGAELRLYPEGGHTLFREAGGDEVADQVGRWMLERARSRASATAAPAASSSPGITHASAN